MSIPVRSFAQANQELVAAFDRYLQSRGFKPATRETYGKSVQGMVSFLHARSVAEADRRVIREFLGKLYARGLDANTIRRHTAGLRCFFKFIRLTGLTRNDPTLLIRHRKCPRRVPRVLTINEMDSLVAAAKNPLESAVVEWLYATGVRVAELVAMRLEDIDFASGVARVHKGKADKDRIVLFGSKADAAIRRMLDYRPPETGLLFEARPQTGLVRMERGAWKGYAYLNVVQHSIRLGTLSDFPTKAEARRAFDRVLAVTPGYKPKPARAFTTRAIHRMIAHMGMRAGIGKAHPHALRRAMATHMLERGADLRVIQDLLGHKRVTTTALYTSHTAFNLKAVHLRCHPKGGENVEE